VSRYHKGKTNLDISEARDSEWQWHQLGHMQICTSLQTYNHASTPPLKFFTGWMPFLLPNQQHQSIEGTNNSSKALIISNYDYNGGITEVDMVYRKVSFLRASLDLGIYEARDVAQNRPLWRLMSLHSAMHS